MKIGNKLTFFYSVITICILVVIMGVYYGVSTYYIHQVYETYLREKAFITAQKYWEKDEVDEQSYHLIQQKYNELLPQAQEILLNVDSVAQVNEALTKYLAPLQRQRLYDYEGIPLNFTYGHEMGAALYYPDNEGCFIVLVLCENQYGRKIQEHLLILAIVLIVLSSVFIFFLGHFYSNRILRPLQLLLKDLKHIQGTNLNHLRLQTTGNRDELDELICSLNNMLDRIDEAFQSEKSFVSNASHEINNPIAAIQGECEITLMKERSIQEYVEALERIAEESKRISQLTKSLLLLSRQDQVMLNQVMEAVNLQSLLIELTAANSRIVLENKVANLSCFTVRANPYLLEVALKNIVDNACKYSKDKVVITSFVSEGVKIVEILDVGIGIPAQELKRVFQSFYCASNTRIYKGQGIGLSLSVRIL